LGAERSAVVASKAQTMRHGECASTLLF